MKASKSPSSVDPISFEVIRNKLQAITEEQALTLKAVSGSPVVTEASDFNNGLYLADGSIVTMGPQVIFHTGTMSSVIKSIVADFAPEDIRDGDMFILNDPYKGAIHQPDVSIVAPIFHQGRHIAWAGSCSHQLDMGGMNFGSWGIGATEIQQEAMLIPGVRIVEQGKLRDDLWRMIMGMTRLPNLLGLDLKAMIAANTVATKRLVALMERYGAATVEQVMHEEISASERLLRERLKTIPDGVYRARDYLEHDGHTNKLYEVVLAVTKRGDTLSFDMEGTSAQAPGFINCTMSGLRGALFTGLLPILAHDIRWNEGVMRPVTITAPEGTLCNATRPAPTSSGTISAAWVVQNVAVAALSRMVACAPHLVREGQAVTKGHMMVMTLAGLGRDGEPFGTFLLDSTAGGGGAYIDHDGLDGSGDYVVPRPTIANVEVNEAYGPYLYLDRSFVPDTGGPGEQRGGAGVGLAVTPHDLHPNAPALHAMMLGHGVEVPNSIGLHGGLPGACGHNLRRSGGGDIGALVRRYGSTAELMEDTETTALGAKPGRMTLSPGDVLAYTFQGGGGYGDPLQRQPDAVATDVEKGLVSRDAARASFGVVLDGVQVDTLATAAQREALRRQRLGGRTPARGMPPAAAATPASSPVPAVSVNRDRHFACRCGHDLGSAHQNWKQHAHQRLLPAKEAGAHVALHAELELREFSCPECASLLAVELVRIDSESLHDVALSA